MDIDLSHMYIYRFTSDVGQVHVHLQVYFRLGTGTCTSTGLLQTWDRYMYIYRLTSDVGQVHVHLQVYFRLGTGTCTSTGLLQTWDRYMSIYRFTSDVGQACTCSTSEVNL
jgi:cytolysin (calcineurin-like family phosphatase)